MVVLSSGNSYWWGQRSAHRRVTRSGLSCWFRLAWISSFWSVSSGHGSDGSVGCVIQLPDAPVSSNHGSNGNVGGSNTVFHYPGHLVVIMVVMAMLVV